MAAKEEKQEGHEEKEAGRTDGGKMCDEGDAGEMDGEMKEEKRRRRRREFIFSDRRR